MNIGDNNELMDELYKTVKAAIPSNTNFVLLLHDNNKTAATISDLPDDAQFELLNIIVELISQSAYISNKTDKTKFDT